MCATYLALSRKAGLTVLLLYCTFGRVGICWRSTDDLIDEILFSMLALKDSSFWLTWSVAGFWVSMVGVGEEEDCERWPLLKEFV